MNSYAKFGVAARRHFSAICEKPMGGGHICAPGRARVNDTKKNYNKTMGNVTKLCGHSFIIPEQHTKPSEGWTAIWQLRSDIGGLLDVRVDRNEGRAGMIMSAHRQLNNLISGSAKQYLGNEW